MNEVPALQKRVRVLALFGGVALLGSERANLEALSALRERGAEVLLLVSDAPWAEEMRTYVLNREFEICQCPYLILPRPERKFNLWIAYPKVIVIASIIAIRKLLTYRPTHLHVSSQLFVINFFPALLISRIPVVYRCGDKPVLHNALFRITWRFIVRRTSRFVAVSRFIANALKNNGVSSDRISVIYSRPPARSKSSTVATSNTEKDIFNIVFVGQVNESKGVHVLIDAFRRVASGFPEARLLIAGRISNWEGDAWARALRNSALRDKSIETRVQFLGFVEDVPGLMAECDVAVIPTLTEEPLANVVFEAKQGETPSIVFPSGGLPETIEHKVDGYVCRDKSVEVLVEALQYYLSDPVRAKRQGLAAKASLSRFEIAEFSTHWSKVYGMAK